MKYNCLITSFTNTFDTIAQIINSFIARIVKQKPIKGGN